MKKYVLSFLITTLVFAFSGCGGSASDEPGTDQTGELEKLIQGDWEYQKKMEDDKGKEYTYYEGLKFDNGVCKYIFANCYPDDFNSVLAENAQDGTYTVDEEESIVKITYENEYMNESVLTITKVDDNTMELYRGDNKDDIRVYDKVEEIMSSEDLRDYYPGADTDNADNEDNSEDSDYSSDDSAEDSGSIKDECIVDTGEKQIWKIHTTSIAFRMSATYEGSGNFIVTLSDSNQNHYATLCNEIGDYVLDDKYIAVQEGATYYLEIISTDGYWNGTWYGTGGQ